MDARQGTIDSGEWEGAEKRGEPNADPRTK